MAKIQQKIELNAQIRTAIGKGLNALRKSGYIPAVLYGKNQEPISLQIVLEDFNKVFKAAGESTLVYVNVSDQIYPTIIHDVAKDSITDDILHADFYKVRLDEKITAHVPVVFIGEAPAVKDLGGIFVRNVNELEVEALPQNLPHELTIDLSVLKNFDDKITIKDLKKELDDLTELTTENDDAVIATVQEPMSEEELQASLEEPTAGVEDVEVIEKEKKEGEETTEETAEETTGETSKTSAPEKK